MKKHNKAITRKVIGWGSCEDYEDSCIIYYQGREIGYINEGDESITFDSDCRDFVETGQLDLNDAPVMGHNSLSLGLTELVELQKILLYWLSDCERFKSEFKK